jgi:tRNA dimethylallyltransferase
MVRITDYYAWGLSGELPKILVILGPTASGKTKLAVKLAKKFNGEIISADSRQVYQGMDIGTGKDLAEYGRVPYHLVDVINPKNQFTVADWQKQTNEAIKDILKKGKLPIICGGTGLYISALVEGYQLKATNSQLIPIRRRLAKLTLKQLLSQLKKIDQKTYQIIDKNNRRRVQRALEIYYQTGQTKSAQLAKQNPPYDFLQIGLTFPKETLRKKMSLRLKHRLEKEGMVAEVKRLHRQGISWQRLEEFGLEYRYIARYLQGKISYRLMQEQLDKAIADFAKRQITWFKRDKKIHWFNDPEKISKFLFRLSG